MKYLPRENITYKTKLNEDEVIKRLLNFIEPEKTFSFGIISSGSIKSYEGQINGQTFKIKRIIGYRNSFLPIINGIIEKDYDGETTIKVKMRLQIFIIVFLFIWCGGAGLIGIAFLTQAFDGSEFNPAILIPFGMLILVYALVMGAFKFESNKSKKDLQSILEAE